MARTKLEHLKRAPRGSGYLNNYVYQRTLARFVPATYSLQTSTKKHLYNVAWVIVKDCSKKITRTRILILFKPLPGSPASHYWQIKTPSSSDHPNEGPFEFNPNKSHTRNYTEETLPPKYRDISIRLLGSHKIHRWPPPEFHTIR